MAEERGHSVVLTIWPCTRGGGKGINGLSLGGGAISKGKFQFKRVDGATKTSVERQRDAYFRKDKPTRALGNEKIKLADQRPLGTPGRQEAEGEASVCGRHQQLLPPSSWRASRVTGNKK